MNRSWKLSELKRAGVVARVKNILSVEKHLQLTALFVSAAFKSSTVSKLLLHSLPTSLSITLYFVGAQMQAEKKQQLVFIGSQTESIDASLVSYRAILLHTKKSMMEESLKSSNS
jgi:hypothetical protein